jgi:glycosyltransferase involved in cell wall biosynthesis
VTELEKSMRILQLAPLWESVPPPAYGGTEAVVSLLTEELVRRGHEVILAASGDSKTSATLLATYERSLRRADDLADRNPYDWMHIAMALREARECDIVHNHAGELPMAMSHVIDTPMLTTLHCLVTPDSQFVWDRYAGTYNTISKSQRPVQTALGRARFLGHVYNAIDVESFPFEAEKGDDLLFLSRVAPEKGPHLAVEVAKLLGRRLLIAGKVDAYDRRFFEEVMRDLIDGEQIVFLGEADAARKRDLYKRARCLLMPLTWEEPFGLVMPEAMACGTPVIALRRGSAPELIVHGRTGFVVDTVEEMAEAVRHVDTIDPYACREHVRANFSPAIMAENYLRLYEETLEQGHLPRAFAVAGTGRAEAAEAAAAGHAGTPDVEEASAVA